MISNCHVDSGAGSFDVDSSDDGSSDVDSSDVSPCGMNAHDDEARVWLIRHDVVGPKIVAHFAYLVDDQH